MQDIHSIGSGGGGGRLFGVGGDRRLRPHNQTHHHHQPLKCPRCESLNTKFCYYNNYNLSQPRHFCKGCRRYWTKGGVLRNVPVGGGCRKAKRSKPKQTSTSEAPQQERKSNSNSSSESSSLTATTAATAAAPTTTTAATEILSASSSTSVAPSLFNFPDSRFFLTQSTNPSFDPRLIDQTLDDVGGDGSGGGMFPAIGSFTSLMTSSADLGFNIADISSYRLHPDNSSHFIEDPSPEQQWGHQQNQKMVEEESKIMHEDITAAAGFMDQTAQIEFLQSNSAAEHNGGVLPPLDWQVGGIDQGGLFDLTGTGGGDHQSYWNQTQWTDNHDGCPLNYLP